eukprot:TRINITY_DN2396_c0_g2_i1.p1 TRINITY_DN2396_c0_g2~~TRINITY_DN2396_c0_g2_i1.p1  ORF type:complete len:183 (+),score=39.00 TRINITY_DN2396_c0_g2_i1:533-1081(+)
MVISPTSTAAAAIYSSLLRGETKPNIGDQKEICPLSMAVAQKIAHRIGSSGGAALIVDYGEDRASTDTLRGIRGHEFCSPLASPGQCDLTVDVDFAFIRRSVASHPNLKVSGPVTQSLLLQQLGIQDRLTHLLRHAKSKEEAEIIISGCRRLVEPDQMGTKYKALAIYHKDLPQPPGFVSAV